MSEEQVQQLKDQVQQLKDQNSLLKVQKGQLIEMYTSWLKISMYMYPWVYN